VLRVLDRLVDEIGGLNCKLVLVIGPPNSGKSKLLVDLARHREVTVLNVGLALGRSLLSAPLSRRHLQAPDLLRELEDKYAANGLTVLDNIELLFDRTLQLDPLDLLKRHARARRVVAAWPGDLNVNRIYYAMMGHPEHRDYSVNGLVPFRIR
jgi:hypothetical protein